MKKAYHYMVLSLVLLDLLAVNAAMLFAFFLRFDSGLFEVQHSQPLRTYYGTMILQTILLPAVFATQGLYRVRRTVSWMDEFYSVFTSVSITTALVAAIGAFVTSEFDLSRLLLALAWLFSIVLVTVGRFAHHRIARLLRAKGVTEDRVLIVGNGDVARAIIEKMRNNPSLGYRLVGAIGNGSSAGEVWGLRVLGAVADIGRIAREHNVDEVFVASPSLSRDELLDIVSHCRGAKVGIKVYPDLFQIMSSEPSISDLGGLPLVTVKDLALKGWNLALKRALDLTVSAAALVLLSPLMLLIALLVKLTSPEGPVFYFQERVGLDGKPFQIIKYRSMRPDAEAATGPVWAKAGDSRTTRLGKWLRRLSLDELPQFINVLIGEMSLVGPRPERPFFVEQFKERIPRYWERHTEKAGILGWAQINGLRGDTSIEERTAYDLWYVENWTIWLDIKILLRGIFVVFGDKNAY